MGRYAEGIKGWGPQMGLFLSVSLVVLLVLMVLASRLAFALKMIVALAIGAIGVIAIAIFFVGDSGVIQKGGSLPIWGQSPWKELLLFFAMLLGMSAKYLWDLIEIRRGKNASRKPGEPRIGIEFDLWDFVQPLLVAALVFAAVLAAIKEFNATSFLFSFQNGFFWQAVLKQKSLATQTQAM